MYQPTGLTDDQKLLIVGAGCSFVIIVLAATVCLVQPTCYIHKKIWGKKERDRAARIRAAKQMGIPIPLAIMSTELKKSHNSLGTDDDDHQQQPRKEASFQAGFNRGGPRDSTYSSMSSGSRGETSTINESLPESSIPEDGLAQGHVTISVRIIPQPDPENERIIGQLGVNVKDAQDLPIRPYGGLCDPYTVVQVVRDVRRLRKKKKGLSKVCEFTTQIKRKTQCPLFNEGFLVPVTLSDVREGGVFVKVFDAEKYSNHSNLGEALVPLKKYDLEQPQGQGEHIVTLDLSPPNTHFGEIQLGLNYLPTSERLTLRVLTCSNVQVNASRQDVVELVLRVLLFHNGKLVKRKKTAPKVINSSTLHFEESVTFDVPQAEIDSVAFIIVLCSSAMCVSSPETPMAPPMKNHDSNKDFIGKVILGSATKGSCLRHWEAMKASPRREVIQWQALV